MTLMTKMARINDSIVIRTICVFRG
jgi:hypothetical protein